MVVPNEDEKATLIEFGLLLKSEINNKFLLLSYMQLNTQIKAFLFLGIFSLVMLHQAVPHLHHHHEQEKAVAETHLEHSHEHQHDKSEKDTKSVLSVLFALHTHMGNSSEVLLTKTATSDFKQKRQYKDIKNREVEQVVLDAFPPAEKSYANFRPPKHYLDPYLANLFLRGPPAGV